VNGCHDAEDTEWKTGLDGFSGGGARSSCDDCHNGGNNAPTVDKTLDQGGYPAPSKSSAAKHSLHIANDAYVPNDCADCHDTPGAAGHVNAAVATRSSLAYNSGNKTCTTNCHVTSVTKTWTTGATLVCVDCHAGTYVGGDRTGTGGSNFLPQSGLHDETPNVTGVRHDDSFLYSNGTLTADCITCHSASPTRDQADVIGGHINGTFDASIGANDTTGAQEDKRLALFEVETSPAISGITPMKKRSICGMIRAHAIT